MLTTPLTATVIIDGLADSPGADGSTPLKDAYTPALDRLAGRGMVGRWQPTPDGCLPGSEVGLFSCLRMTPPKVGRAVFEALGRGIALRRGEVAYRVSPVRLSGPIDRSGSLFLDGAPGAVAYDALVSLAEWLQEAAGIRLFPSHAGRHIMVIAGADPVTGIGPHQLTGLPVRAAGPLPGGVPWAAIQERLGGIALWPWGGAAVLPPQKTDGVALRHGVLIAAVPLVKGIGRWLGLRVPNVPGATGDVDTDLGAKANAAIDALDALDAAADGEGVIIHVEGPDMAAHRKDFAAKRAAIEAIDAGLIAPLAAAIDRMGGRLMVTCDHGTDSASGRHLDTPVPYLLYDAIADRAGTGLGGKIFCDTSCNVPDAPVLDAAAWQRLLVEAPVGC